MLLLLLFAVFARSDQCQACDGCEQIESAHVNKLCANELCVNGNPVPPGDGDPCTVNDIDNDGSVLTVHIKDCCRIAEDCVKFRPSACYLSTCEYEADEARGWCEHKPIVGCCVDDGDCPTERCKTYACEGACEDSEPLFFTESHDSPHKTPWMKRNINFATECKTCVATPIENCCLTSADCHPTSPNSPCTENEQGICDGNDECQCVPITQVECTHATQDADCAYLLPKLEQCPNECAGIECVKGYCVITADPNADNDEDGIKCPDDCDDNDPLASEFVYCANNTAETNFDEDAFLKCGTNVERVCGACGEDQVEVDETLIECNGHPEGPCIITDICDCCDNSASQDRPDHTICCKADCEPDNEPINCGGDPRSICVTKPATEQTLNAECHAWGVATGSEKNCDCSVSASSPEGTCDDCWTGAVCPIENYCMENEPTAAFCEGLPEERKRTEPACVAYFSQKKRQVTAEECDECPNDPGFHPTEDCFLDCDGDGQPICPLDTTNVVDCCTSLHDRPTNWEFVDEDIKACCEAILAFPNFPSDGNAVTLIGGACTVETTPFIPLQCSCPTGYVQGDTFDESNHQDMCDCTAALNDDFITTCDVDADLDCTQDCTPVRICVAVDANQHPGPEVCENAGYYPLLLTGQESLCDCDPTDSEHTQYQGCFPDVDGDSFLDCTSCLSVCGNCPNGTQPIPVSELLSAGGSVGHRAPLQSKLAKVRKPLAASAAHAHSHKKRVVQCEAPTENNIQCPCDSDVAPGDQCPPGDVITVDNDICDCCDRDPYAYPGSRFCSTSPRVCPNDDESPSFDYNCDDDDDHLVVCEDIDTMGGTDDIVQHGGRYIRGCQLDNNTNTNSDGVFDNAETAGECKLNMAMDDCDTVHGFCLERKRSAGDMISRMRAQEKKKKRAMGDAPGGVLLPAPIECDGMGIVDPEDGDGPDFGDCFEYIEECHKRTHGEPPVSTCHCDCDICVLVGQ